MNDRDRPQRNRRVHDHAPHNHDRRPRHEDEESDDGLKLHASQRNARQNVTQHADASPGTPLAQPGEVAWLKVLTVNNTGAFLDWGRPKDLLLPYGEQNGRVVVGQHCLVCILLDSDDRPFATMKLDNWIHDTVAEGDERETGSTVHIIVAEETDLGVKVVVDHHYWGLLYRDEIFRPLSKGQALRGYVKKQREDGKLDISINPPTHVAAQTLTDRILTAIDTAGGKLALTDKSSPADIQRAFGVSKSVFKQAIGALYKHRKIEITTHGIRRVQDGSAAQ